jgi:hypothetical protein
VDQGCENRWIKLTGSDNFANVGYIETFQALNDEAVRAEAVSRMPLMLQAVFTIPAIHRIRLTAYYPAIDAGGSPTSAKQIGGLEARRAEFVVGKRAEEYPEFWTSP